MYGDKVNDLLDALNEDEDEDNLALDYINNNSSEDSNNDSIIQNVYIKEYYSKTDILDEIIGIFLEYDDVNDLFHLLWRNQGYCPGLGAPLLVVGECWGDGGTLCLTANCSKPAGQWPLSDRGAYHRGQ